MPSGYTAKIYEGEEQSFQDFALTIARAFCWIELRDTPLGPIPAKLKEPDTKYHEEQLAKAKQKKIDMLHISVQAAARRANEEADADAERRAKSAAEREELRGRYEAMLIEAEAYEPPTERHVEFREHMIKQLKQSIDFDCKIYNWPEPTRDGATWIKEQLEEAEREIEYHTKEIEREIERTSVNNEWALALLESLDVEVPAEEKEKVNV